jgi:hypothetical protein
MVCTYLFCPSCRTSPAPCFDHPSVPIFDEEQKSWTFS